MSSFMTPEEIDQVGFKCIGKNVLISKKASFYSPENITLGDNVRIDDFCILSGKISVGSYVHIAAYSALFGGIEGVVICDFCNISSRVTIYALSDDYSGESMTSPLIPDEYKNVEHKKTVLEKHVIIGSNSVVLPGAVLAEGSSYGAFSLVKSKTEPWSIYAGIPCKKIKKRSKKLLDLENEFLKNIAEKQK
ncbi:MAG: acyltransferase [Clostridia bacterium]|nr:acyltransferase [Clostridia bacterium]